MPSPFPGMDPYIEGELWTPFHTQMGVAIAHQLAPKIAPRYVAIPEKRLVVDAPDDLDVVVEEIIPDVAVRRTGRSGPAPAMAMAHGAPVQMETIIAREEPHVWVEIRDARNRHLVTAIEFLSPTNKRGRGRRNYLEKRSKILASDVHLMEIDLVRSGRRLPMKQSLPAAPYFVFLCRARRRPITEVWPIAFDQPLPVVPVPLLSPEADVSLDVQAAFNSVYDLGRFDLLIDYSERPEVPLPSRAAAWAKKIVRGMKH